MQARGLDHIKINHEKEPAYFPSMVVCIAHGDGLHKTRKRPLNEIMVQ